MDSLELENARVQVESACAQFEVPATRQQAEATLLEFRRCPHPLQVCRHILEHSQVVAAQFQALLTLRDVVVRDWGRLAADERAALRAYLLGRLLSSSAGPQEDKLVVSQLSATMAVIIKRGWTEQSKAEHEGLFQEIEGAVLQTGNAQARRRGMEVLTAVVTEFSPPTASAMGLPWAYHERCRMSLETDFLQRFFTHTCGIARDAVSSGAVVQGTDGGTVASCIALLSTILSWDFQRGGGGVGGGGFGFVPESAQKGGTASDTLQIHLGPGWRPVLLAPGAIGWLLELVLAMHQPGGPAAEALPAARQLAVQLCSVTGDIFSREGEGLEARRQWCGALLRAVLGWCVPIEAAVHAAEAGSFELQEKVQDCCRALHALACTHHAAGIAHAAEGTELAVSGADGGAFRTIAALSRAVICLGDVEEGLEGGWSQSCAEILLDTWVALLEETGRPGDQAGQQAASQAAYAVFEAFAATALRDLASALDCEDDDEGEEGGSAARADDWMSRLAVLGRASAGQTLPLLSGLLGQRLQQLQACATSGQDPSLALEELCWLLRCTSHVLADSGDGETPMLPLPLHKLAESPLTPDGRCLIQELSTGLLTVTCVCLDPAARPVMSPRLLEVAASGAARWARTYLLPEEQLPGTLATAYSAQMSGMQALDSLVKVARDLLSTWPGEVQLHLVASKQLLSSLICRSPLAAAVVRLESWQLLTHDFANRADWTRNLTSRSQRALAHAIVAAGSGLASPEETHQYLVSCLGFLPSGFAALVHSSSASGAQQSAAATEAANLLDVVRGAAGATSGSNMKSLWSLIEALLPQLLSLYQCFRKQQLVVTLVLKVGHDLVEANISFVSDEQAKSLCLWVVELIRMHAANRSGQTGIGGGKAIHVEAEEESYKELRALLKLLTQLTQRDVTERSQGSGVDVAQAVFAGLELILPLINTQIAKFPKLRLAYFGLLSYMAEVHAARLAALHQPQFTALAGSLEYGIRNVLEAEAVQAVMEAVAALGKWHLTESQGGRLGLSNCHMASGALAIPALMEAILHRLLFEDTAGELSDSAADALLPMLLSSPGTYQALGMSLLNARSAAGDSAASQEALAQALTELVEGMTDGSSRVERRRFRGRLGKFLVTVRGIVRTR